jgi:hypothetical protein
MHSAQGLRQPLALKKIFHMLRAGVHTFQQSLALLQQPGAVLSLAEAVASIIKACSQPEADSAGPHGTDAAGASAGLWLAVLQHVLPVVQMLDTCPEDVRGSYCAAAADSYNMAAGRLPG